jgi:hypothetical protein
MAKIKSEKTRMRKYPTRPFTPPPDLYSNKGQHPKTPQRCGVFYTKMLEREFGIFIPLLTIRKVTGVTERSQSRILASKQPRTLHNQPDLSPNLRGRKRAILRSETAAIGDYLDDASVPLNDRGKPWLDIATDAGIILSQTTYFKPPGLRAVNLQTI